MVGRGRPSARSLLAEELARLREAAGWSLAELAEKTTYDRSYLLKLEKGEKLGSSNAMNALDRAYETGHHLENLWFLAKADVVPGRYRRFMDLETLATVRQQYSVSTIPGLLQTKAYATEVLSLARPLGEERLEEQVAARISRQDVLYGEQPQHFRALLDESAIRRPTRDPAAWLEQLHRLVEDAQRPNISVQIVPFKAGLHHLLGGSLTLLWLRGGKTVAYLESSKTGDLIEEPEDVEQLKLSYDLLRDAALPPGASLDLIRQAMEDRTSCLPPDLT
ncbi:Scr1 family TA system antitoxin-like transcriptional regulator [Streptomyces polygonati]|uniref:Scr1 family TA system antitoxin-like transcriptional regulator n=1 Tax=Streptomyces polygonati TaxID=1617087 RepID=A0ABV8HL33_9ACTN